MRHELLQLLAEGCLYDLDSDCVQKCVEPVFTFLRVGPEMYVYFTLLTSVINLREPLLVE